MRVTRLADIFEPYACCFILTNLITFSGSPRTPIASVVSREGGHARRRQSFNLPTFIHQLLPRKTAAATLPPPPNTPIVEYAQPLSLLLHNNPPLLPPFKRLLPPPPPVPRERPFEVNNGIVN